MKIIKKHGLALVHDGDKVYFSNLLKFAGGDPDDFLPGTGGIYTFWVDSEFYDGMGLCVKEFSEHKDGITVVFENDETELCIMFNYHIPSGVWSRRDIIKNKTADCKIIRKYQSRFVIEEGFSEPEFYTQNSGWCSENQGSWQSAGRGIRIETRGLRVNDGATPYMAVKNKNSQSGIAFHIAPIGKWSANVTKRIAYTRRAAYVMDMGLSDNGLSMKLEPFEELKMPEILFHSFDDISLGSYKAHRFLLEERFNPNPMKVIYNSWLYNFDNFTLTDLKRQLCAASEIGCDCFLIDAGWYGDVLWSSGTGDWQESKNKFPDGLKLFADEVKKKGVGLGLWMECERASKHSEIYKKHPEYFFETEDDTDSVIVDFSILDARKHVFNEISRLIDTYDLKMMKFDFNVGCTHDKTGSNFYRYYQNFYEMMDELKAKYPDFFFEGCAGGGCLSDISSMSHYDCHHMTDTVNPLKDLRIYQGAVLRLPPYSLSKWVCVQNAELKSQNVSYQTEGRIVSNSNQFLWERMADCNFDFTIEQASMGLLGFSSDIAALDEDTRNKLKCAVDEFKKNASERIKFTGALLSPPAPLDDASSPAVFQFSDFDFNKIIIKAFRTEGVERTFITEPVGIKEDAVYEIITDEEKTKMSGAEIKEYGLKIKVEGFFEVKTVTLTII